MSKFEIFGKIERTGINGRIPTPPDGSVSREVRQMRSLSLGVAATANIERGFRSLLYETSMRVIKTEDPDVKKVLFLSETMRPAGILTITTMDERKLIEQIRNGQVDTGVVSNDPSLLETDGIEIVRELNLCYWEYGKKPPAVIIANRAAIQEKDAARLLEIAVDTLWRADIRATKESIYL